MKNVLNIIYKIIKALPLIAQILEICKTKNSGDSDKPNQSFNPNNY